MNATQELVTQSDDKAQARCLYVGDLSPEVTDDTLLNFFGNDESIESTKVCRYLTSKLSMGYGYVNFKTHEAAKNAFVKYNYSIIIDRPCRIMWCNKSADLRKSSKGNLFIKNIDRTVDCRTVYEAFSTFGEILSFKIETDSCGNSKGFGFIHFAKEEQAKNVIDSVNGIVINNKKIVICPFLTKKDRGDSSKGHLFNNVFVKHFVDDLTVEEVLKMFSAYGELTSTHFPEDSEGKPKGWGFICFDRFECAYKACQELNGKQLKSGQSLYAVKAVKKSERAHQLLVQNQKHAEANYSKNMKNNCYIKNLSEETTEEDLINVFSKYGEIVSCKIVREEDGKSRKFGYVCFSNDEEAANAIKNLNKSQFKEKELYVALHKMKSVRFHEVSTDQRLKDKKGPHYAFSDTKRPLLDAPHMNNPPHQNIPQIQHNARAVNLPPQEYQMKMRKQGPPRDDPNVRPFRLQNHKPMAPPEQHPSSVPPKVEVPVVTRQNEENNTDFNVYVPQVKECFDKNGKFSIPPKYETNIFNYLMSHAVKTSDKNPERTVRAIMASKDVLGILNNTAYVEETLKQAQRVKKH